MIEIVSDQPGRDEVTQEYFLLVPIICERTSSGRRKTRYSIACCCRASRGRRVSGFGISLILGFLVVFRPRSRRFRHSWGSISTHTPEKHVTMTDISFERMPILLSWKEILNRRLLNISAVALNMIGYSAAGSGLAAWRYGAVLSSTEAKI